MNRLAAVIIGGGIGAGIRYGVQNWALGRFGAIFPYGTLLVNITGAFCIGVAMTIFLHHVHLSPVWRVFIVTGILGGYTTFSALAWETFALFTKETPAQSFLYAGGSFVGGMLALLIGVFLGNLI